MKTKGIQIGDQFLTLNHIESLRKELIALRDSALATNHFDWSVTISLTIALLASLIERLENE